MSVTKPMQFFKSSKKFNISDPIDVELLARFVTPEKKPRMYPIMLTSYDATFPQNLSSGYINNGSTGFSNLGSYSELSLRGSVTPLK